MKPFLLPYFLIFMNLLCNKKIPNNCLKGKIEEEEFNSKKKRRRRRKSNLMEIYHLHLNPLKFNIMSAYDKPTRKRPPCHVIARGDQLISRWLSLIAPPPSPRLVDCSQPRGPPPSNYLDSSVHRPHRLTMTWQSAKLAFPPLTVVLSH